MSGFGTDIVALACIVGSAATSGAATLAFQNRDAPASAGCSVEALTVSPNVVVSGAHGSHAVVLSTPRIRVRGAEDCQGVVAEGIRFDLKRMRRDVDRARIQIEAARARAEEARERVHVIRIRGDEARMVSEDHLEQVKAAREEIEAALEQAKKARAEALARVQEEQEASLKEVKKGSGGQMD